jgi:hypothetical protein
MATSTINNGDLKNLLGCYLQYKNTTVYPHVLPEISDAHGAQYSDEPVMGRSMPVKVFNAGSDRTISWRWKFVSTSIKRYEENLKNINFLKSLTYPMDETVNVPFLPPPIVTLKCGALLGSTPVSAVCTSCNVSYPTDVVWGGSDSGGTDFLPFEINVETSFSVVYKPSNLPGQERIMKYGT